MPIIATAVPAVRHIACLIESEVCRITVRPIARTGKAATVARIENIRSVAAMPLSSTPRSTKTPKATASENVAVPNSVNNARAPSASSLSHFDSR